MHFNVVIRDGTTDTKDKFGGDSGRPTIRRSYRVLKSLFKNGRSYEPNERIELDPATAAGFLDLNEIKEWE